MWNLLVIHPNCSIWLRQYLFQSWAYKWALWLATMSRGSCIGMVQVLYYLSFQRKVSPLCNLLVNLSVMLSQTFRKCFYDYEWIHNYFKQNSSMENIRVPCNQEMKMRDWWTEIGVCLMYLYVENANIGKILKLEGSSPRIWIMKKV